MKYFLKKIISIQIINLAVVNLVKAANGLIPDTIKLKIPLNTIFEHTFSNCKTAKLLATPTDRIARNLYWEDFAFEPSTQPIFEKLIKIVTTFLDVGANIGYYSIKGKILNPDLNVYSLEILEFNTSILKKNIELNNLNISVESVAVSNTNNTIKINVAPENTIDVGYSITDSKSIPDYHTISKKSITLDRFAEIKNIENDEILIKMDIEGHEPAALEGAKHLLLHNQPYIIIEIVRKSTVSKINKIFKNLNYYYYWISEGKLIKQDKINVLEQTPNMANNYLLSPVSKTNKLKNLNLL